MNPMPIDPIVELNPDGGVRFPAEVLEAVKPHTHFIIKMQAGALVLYPTNSGETDTSAQPLWATATPQEQAASFRQWASSFTKGPGLPDEALRRESMYD